MRSVYAEIKLANGGDVILHRRGLIDESEVKKMSVKVLVANETFTLKISEKIKTQLDLPVIGKQLVYTADRNLIEVEVVAPVEIYFENRSTTLRAFVYPDESAVQIGTIALDDMDVLLDPKRQRLIVNPEHPYVATKHLK